MRKLKLFTLYITLALISCERDDICAETTSTTPRLLIEFYDTSEPDELKSVSRLTVYGESLFLDEDGILIPPTEESDSTLLYNENFNAVELPLEIRNEGDPIITRFILEKDTDLRLDDDNTTESNIDIIEISYSARFIYVSRACGYKSIFNLFDIDIDADGDTWINNIDIIETTIEDENTVHVQIFH